MDIADLQDAVSAASARHLADASQRTDEAEAEVAREWAELAARADRDGWSPSLAIDLGNATVRVARELTGDLGRSGVEHGRAEVRIISAEAAEKAVAKPPTLDTTALTSIVLGMVDRVAATVAGAEHKAAAILAETYQAERIVETEGFRHYNAGRGNVAAALAKAGDGDTFTVPTSLRKGLIPAIVLQWDASLDKRTCPTCRDLDGALRPLGMFFDGRNDPPVHPRCRCALRYWPILIPGS